MRLAICTLAIIVAASLLGTAAKDIIDNDKIPPCSLPNSVRNSKGVCSCRKEYPNIVNSDDRQPIMCCDNLNTPRRCICPKDHVYRPDKDRCYEIDPNTFTISVDGKRECMDEKLVTRNKKDCCTNVYYDDQFPQKYCKCKNNETEVYNIMIDTCRRRHSKTPTSDNSIFPNCPLPNSVRNSKGGCSCREEYPNIVNSEDRQPVMCCDKLNTPRRCNCPKDHLYRPDKDRCYEMDPNTFTISVDGIRKCVDEDVVTSNKKDCCVIQYYDDHTPQKYCKCKNNETEVYNSLSDNCLGIGTTTSSPIH